MSFYSPWGLLALLGVPVIIILYLLKQKHTDYTISSLYLWQNAVRDLEANAPWQRLRNNLLMILQILAIILLALILSEPVIKTGENGDKAVLLVLDMTLGMQSTDVKPSRFEAAKKDMAELVSSYGPGTKFSIVASGRSPYIVQHMVGDKNRTLQEIKDLSVTDCAGDMDGTIELADSLARENPGMEIHWFGDERNPVSESLLKRNDRQVKYYSYNRNGANYAVAALSHRKLESSPEMTVLSRIANYSEEDAELDVSLYTDGRFFDARRVKVEANGNESVYWLGVPESVSSIECRIDTEDTLPKDNSAVDRVFPAAASKVLLATENNLFLEKVLSLMSGIELYRTTPEDIGNLKGFDIYIFDGMLPEQLPEDGHIMLFAPDSGSSIEYLAVSGTAEYTTVKPSAHVFFSGLQQDMSFGAMKTNLYTLPQWAGPLMQTEEGIAAFEGFMGRNRLMVFGFDLHNTNLPVKPFFPILMTRAIEALTPGNMQSLSSAYAGDAIELPVDPEADEVYVITPAGDRISVAPPFPAPSFDGTLEAGMYTLEQHMGNEITKTEFYVNVPSEREFALAAGASVPVNEAGRDSADSNFPGGGRRLRSLLLWLLLIILLAEWWVYTNGHTV